MSKSSIKLEFNHYNDLADKLHHATVEVAKQAAFNVEHRAKGKAAVDTGFMHASGYTVTTESSGFSAADADAKAASEKGVMLDEEPAPERDTTAVVVFGAAHSIYVEFGTVNMAAQPFLTPAVEEERPDWERAVRMLGEKLKSA